MSNQDVPEVAKYSDVDGQTDSAALVSFMDFARTWPLMPEQKKRSIDELRLAEGYSALDIGCGTGEEVVTMAEIVGQSGRAVGLDLSEAMLTEAQRRTESLAIPVEFHKGDIYELPFENGIFNATRAERVFEHLERPDAAFTELLRVTKAGGRIVAISPDVDCHACEIVNRDLTRKLIHYGCDERTNGWAGRQLYGIFAQSGMIDLTCTAYYHIFPKSEKILVALKKRVQRALEDGAITKAESDAALDYLKNQDNMFFATPNFLMAGTKP